MQPITYTPIGIIHTPFTEQKGTPIQPPGAAGVAGRIEVAAEYEDGLKDLDGFSHIILIYHFHRSQDYVLTVKPFMDDTPRGLFATRAPRRPNPIGLSVVRLVRIEGTTLHIEGIDVLDGTPLLDLKPYVPQFDAPENAQIGWLSGNVQQVDTKRADERFQGA